MEMSMFEMVRRFPDQLKEGLELFKLSDVSSGEQAVLNIYISGMGGSAVGADFVEAIVRDVCNVPITVGKSYTVPHFISENTLAIVSSYSGNTEETISSYHQLVQRGAKVVVISSGGELIRRAHELKQDIIQLPSGWSSPRACLSYSLVAQLYALHKLNIIDHFYVKQLIASIKLMEDCREEIIEQARQLADLLQDKWVVIYSSDHFEPVCLRFRQQINENSKMLCWHNVIPEMNHNELVGWRWNHPFVASVFIRDREEYSRIQARMELTKEVVGHYAASVMDIYARGDSYLEKSLYLVHLLDFVSVFLAEKNQVDAVEVRVIDFLKTELSKLPQNQA
ncbi:MAG: bifunctional phosphoglucose/phosphomannose isomerase [Saprospiraceae bacterium]|nr:bifunctional phosphoglucose/phosphomannose isomerase [Saprospiraceae bacterium]